MPVFHVRTESQLFFAILPTQQEAGGWYIAHIERRRLKFSGTVVQWFKAAGSAARLPGFEPFEKGRILASHRCPHLNSQSL